MHTTSGRWQLGLLLSLVTAVLWGLLPIALKGLLDYTNAVTITGFRFLIASLFLGVYLTVYKRLPKLAQLKRPALMTLLIIVLSGLLGNYILYMYGLSFVPPESGQVMIQTAPMLLLLGGLIVFKESFSTKQWIGVGIFSTGLVLFFNLRLSEIIRAESDYSWGIFLVILAGVLWAAYALAQKQLLKFYASEEIMLMVYISGVIVFVPFSSLNVIYELDTLGWILLLFCGANTLIAYGAFAEALDHWEASRVSATLAITPLLTMGFMQLTEFWFPGYMESEKMNSLSFLGASLVVAGSTVTALSNKKKAELPRNSD